MKNDLFLVFIVLLKQKAGEDMSNKEKIRNLNEAIEAISRKESYGRNQKLFSDYSGKAGTVIEFWDKFVSDKTPQKEDTGKEDKDWLKKCVMNWHNMFMEYIERDDAVFAIRGGASAGYLRRGWLTKVANDNYSFFYADNDFAFILYSIIMCGYSLDDPKAFADEFYETLKAFKLPKDIPWLKDRNKAIKKEEERHYSCFPVHFHKYGGESNEDKKENIYNAMMLEAPNCPLATYYKHSHITGVRDAYVFESGPVPASYFDTFFPLGESEDWKWDSNINNYTRKIEICDNEKEKVKRWIKAEFLRFVDPLNHFLAPKAPYQGIIYNSFKNTDGAESNDIAEYPPLLALIRTRYQEVYGDEYKRFLETILAPDVSDKLEYVKKEIKLEYDSKGLVEDTCEYDFIPDKEELKKQALIYKRVRVLRKYKDGTEREIFLDIHNNYGLITQLGENNLQALSVNCKRLILEAVNPDTE